jgi:hypothetical protein
MIQHDPDPQWAVRRDSGSASAEAAPQHPSSVDPARAGDTPPPGEGDHANAALRHEEEVRRIPVPLRAGALILAAGSFVAVGLILFRAGRVLIREGWSGLSDPIIPYWPLLIAIPLLLGFGYRLWRAGWGGVDPGEGERVSEEFESRALLAAVQRYDLRRTEVQTVADAEAGGEPTDRGFEARSPRG